MKTQTSHARPASRLLSKKGRSEGSVKPQMSSVVEFQRDIRDYYKKHGRVLPWRETRDPYRILVSEIMLQQTQVDRVVPFFGSFIKKFPSVRALARAPQREVLKSWQGLGYNRRAIHLHRAAKMLVEDHGGVFPKTVEALDALPGVGSYTAGAITAFAFDIASPIIETNIRGVYLHFFFKGQARVHDSEILKLVSETLPERRVREWYYALMDYGAMLKRQVGNPNRRSTHYMKQAPFRGSRRELRGEILRRAHMIGRVRADDFASFERAGLSVRAILSALVSEGFLTQKRGVFEMA